MGLLNKEKVVFLVALTIAVYLLATAFSGEDALEPVPGELPSPDSGEIMTTPIPTPKPKFLEHSFEEYWGTYDENKIVHVWRPPKVEVKLTPEIIPLPEPGLVPLHALVPSGPHAPLPARRSLIWQVRPPVAVEQETPESGDDGTNGE